MSRWYRAYEGTVTDPKLAEAAMIADCSRSVAVAGWHLILENAAVINDGGRIDLPTRRIAAALVEPLAVVESLVEAFTAIGLIRDAHVAAWSKRQYESDSSAKRTRDYRERKKVKASHDVASRSCDVTSPSRDVPETESETEYSEANAPAAIAASIEPKAVDVVKTIFDTAISILTAAGKDARTARSILGRWRKTYSDSIVLAVLSRCQMEQPSEPVEWIAAALQAETRRASGNAHVQYQPTRESTSALALRLAAEAGGSASAHQPA